MKKKQLSALTLTNTLGGFGYISLLLQWLWLVVLYGPTLADTPLREFLFPREKIVTTPDPLFSFEPSFMVLFFSGVVTVLIIAMTLYVLIKTPSAVGKTGQKVTQSAAKSVLPVVTRHKPMEKKMRLRLTARFILLLKTGFIMLPFLGTLPTVLLPEVPLDLAVSVVVASLCAFLSIGLFGLQYLLAHVFKIPASRLW